jgi:hypothetical protein
VVAVVADRVVAEELGVAAVGGGTIVDASDVVDLDIGAACVVVWLS